MLFVIGRLQNDGWKLLIPVVIWFGIGFTIAFELPSAAMTAVTLIVVWAVAGAFVWQVGPKAD